MQKKPGRNLLAGIIPTYSLSSLQRGIPTSVNWNTDEKNTLLDYAIFTCSRVFCDLIIIVCRPEQVPYFRLKYGDVFLNYANAYYKDVKINNEDTAKPVPIYYFCVSEKYRDKIDNDSFCVFNAAHCFAQAIDETFSFMSPTHFFFCFPTVVISPDHFLKDGARGTATFWQLWHDYSDQAKTQRRKFQFRIKETKELMPRHSHSILFLDDIKEIWQDISTKYRDICNFQQSKTDFMNNYLNFEKIASPYLENYELFYDIPKEYVFNVENWNEYVDLLVHNQKEENLDWQKIGTIYLSKYVKNMGKLTYHYQGPIIQDIPYLIKKTRKSRKIGEFDKWINIRKSIRGENK
jgi:Rad3-related DNA helicase